MPVADPRFTGLDLDTEVAADLQGVLPRMAERTVAAIIAEVPAYTDPFRGRMGQNIENAVQASLGAFLRLATRGGDSASDPAVVAALDGAYELGAARHATAGPSTRCSRPTGWARGWPGGSCRRRRSAPACPPRWWHGSRS